MENIILTGFKPFGPYKYNPVQDVAMDFNKKIINNIKVHGLVLPCTYKGAFELLKKASDELNPIAIISMGLSSTVGGIRVETTAQNLMNGKYSDANGLSPQYEPIIQDGDYFLEMNSNSQKIANILKGKGIPTEISANADTFICNSLMYLIALYIQTNNLDIKNVFLHTPWTDNFKNIIGELEPGKIWIPKTYLDRSVESIIKNVENI